MFLRRISILILLLISWMVNAEDATHSGRWHSSQGHEAVRNATLLNDITDPTYSFELTTTRSVEIFLDTSSDTDAYLYLFRVFRDYQLILIDEDDDDSSGNTDARINAENLQPGKYIVVATTRNSGKTGDYAIELTTSCGYDDQDLTKTGFGRCGMFEHSWSADDVRYSSKDN